MPGNERFLVPELFAFMLGGIPSTHVYLNAERFAGAKRGGSPNLAKLACAGRLMHQKKGLSPKISKTGNPDPNAEFAEWMEYELAHGWMWNEQGPSPIYDWMHLLPQIAFAAHGSGRAQELSQDWIRQYFDILEICKADGCIVQAGMRGVGHGLKDDFNEWMFEYLATGNKKNEYWKKHMSSSQMAMVVLEHYELLEDLFSTVAQNRWPVRVEQHVYQYEHGTVAIISRAGNGNTQERAADIKIKGRPQASFPVGGGYRKQGNLDDMACWLDEPMGTVFYRSEQFTDNKLQSYHLEGAGDLMAHWVWNKEGLGLAEGSDPMQSVPDVPLAPLKPNHKKRKWWQTCK